MPIGGNMNYKGLYQGRKIARKMFKRHHGFYPEHIPTMKVHIYRQGIDGVLGVYRKTKVPCSNPLCCGNPRKMKRTKQLTMQERKALIDEVEQLEEV